MSRMFSAHVHNGVIVADDVPLTEGATVTVFDDVDLDVGDNELTAEQQDLIEQSRAELARGEGISAGDLMETLRRDRATRAASDLAPTTTRPR